MSVSSPARKPDGFRYESGQRGFALLIVVTMLAFIVILLVGLAAYSRIETSIAGNSQRQAQARENALLALNVALGQLQRYAGPDARATATAHNFVPAEATASPNGTLHYTGVWSSDPTATESPTTPLTWLVSGNEFTQPDPNPEAAEGSTIPAPRVVVPGPPGNRTVDLVGRNTTGSASRTSAYVVARLADITAPGVPGALPGANTVIGRYAWWVGDQGVKAPVAVPDTSGTVTFAPYDSAELRSRIRQQIPLGAGAADAAGEVVFEPRDSNNANLVAGQKITTANQFAFLRNASNSQLGLTRARQNFHTWSPNNYAVIANSKTGGLRQDLSLQPSLLGTAFTAWANYPAYMERVAPEVPGVDGEGNPIPVAPLAAPVISPEYGSDPLRRRFILTPHLFDETRSGSHQVGPVPNYFLITFNVRTESGSEGTKPLEVRARWMVSLWNPYTSALVPEDLRIEVSGLPNSITVVNETEGRAGPLGSFSLIDSSVFGSPAETAPADTVPVDTVPADTVPADGGGAVSTGLPLRIKLPWVATDADGNQPVDRQSWLPGRVYTWRSAEDKTKGATPPEEGYASDFYSQTLSHGGDGVIRPLSLAEVDGNDLCHLEVANASDNLRIRLFVMRASGPVLLGTYISPEFVKNFVTTSQKASGSDYQFSYVFRLAESIDTPAAPGAWLTTDGRDVRRRTVQSEAYVVAENGNDPAQYGNSYSKIRNPDRLLDRATDSFSYNEDVPLFELPRSPILSVGALQHFRQPGQRPFMIGNPWGANFQLNNIRLGELFDRFFFSGLVDGVTPGTTSTGDLILPNPLMKPLRSWDVAQQAYRKPTIDDIRALMNPPTTTDPNGNIVPGPAPSSASSKFLIQGGAFNLNSINGAAWAAVLRGVRFPTQSFTYLNPSDATGNGADTDTLTVQSGDAQIFRFSQSAQETYKAEAGMAESSPSAEGPSAANTHLFRRGMRTLTAAQVGALSNRIVELVAVKQAAEGPFRSLDEMISPSALFAGTDPDGNVGSPRSLLEAAIADAGLNSEIAEFSSQWLTQGDIMTALAPILFPRSDTFVIRTYGEVVNPSTNATEGRAWCEAIVQRVPGYLDHAMDAPEVLPEALTSELNKQHGRRFKVVSFRWLTRADI